MTGLNLVAMRKMHVLPVLMAAALAATVSAAGSGSRAPDAPGNSGTQAQKPATHRVSQSESYLGVEPLYTTIFDGNHPLGLLMVGIGLDVPDAALRDRVDRDMPQLRDGYVRVLMAFTTTDVRSWRQPDVAAIADRLQGATDRILGKRGARVLLSQVAIRLNR
jgi:flagellar basal body-associated protein FliL